MVKKKPKNYEKVIPVTMRKIYEFAFSGVYVSERMCTWWWRSRGDSENVFLSQSYFSERKKIG